MAKKNKILNSILNITVKQLMLGIIALGIGITLGLELKSYVSGESFNKIETLPTTTAPTATLTPNPPSIMPTISKTTYVDLDPIEPCTSKYSEDSVSVRRSECQNKYVDCQINNTWKVLTKEDCTKQQTNNNTINTYPPCTIYYKYSGYSKTYNNLSPADCLYWKQKASTVAEPITLPTIEAKPFPTIAPYQYSQEYLNSINNSNQELTRPWQPSQFVAPTQKCYASWGEYFNAHPNYAPQNIIGMSDTPPCE